MERWITVGQAKDLLGVGSANTVKRWINNGKLKVRRLGESIQVDRESIDALLNSQDAEIVKIRRAKALVDADEGLGLEDTEVELAEEYSLKRYGRLPWEDTTALTPDEVSDLCGVPLQAVERACENEEIKATKVGKSWMIPRLELTSLKCRQWLDNKKARPARLKQAREVLSQSKEFMNGLAEFQRNREEEQ